MFPDVPDVVLKGSLEPVSAPLVYKPFTPDLRCSKRYSGYGGQDEADNASTPEAVRVAVRVRPPIGKELQAGGKTCVRCSDCAITVSDDRKFYFDHVFGAETAQATVYTTCIPPLLKGFVSGYNATVLAYGQTGSGKTFTMGTDAERLANSEFGSIGILPRLVTDLYKSIEKERADGVEFSVSCQFLEIYQEEIRDLLSPGTPSKQIAIREADSRILVSGAQEVEAADFGTMMSFFFAGCNARTTGATLMNLRSSRSHAVFTIILKRVAQEPTGAESVTVSKLHLVDLAGSERNKKTGAQGLRFKESVNINKGLLALGNVITALGDPSKRGGHVPYRQSRITRLLQDSLGGNSQTLMIACCSPDDSNRDETLNTLKYANRARNIKNKPKKLIGLSMDEICALQQALIAEVHTTLKHGSPSLDSQAIIAKLNGESLWRVMVQLAHGIQQAGGAIPPPPRDDILRAAKLLTDVPETSAPIITPTADTAFDSAATDVIKSSVGDGTADRAATAAAEQPKLKAMSDSLAALRGEHAKLVECIRETSAALEHVNLGFKAALTDRDAAARVVASASASLAAIVANLDTLVSLVTGDDSDSELSDGDGGVPDEAEEDAARDDEWSPGPTPEAVAAELEAAQPELSTSADGALLGGPSASYEQWRQSATFEQLRQEERRSKGGLKGTWAGLKRFVARSIGRTGKTKGLAPSAVVKVNTRMGEHVSTPSPPPRGRINVRSGARDHNGAAAAQLNTAPDSSLPAGRRRLWSSPRAVPPLAPRSQPLSQGRSLPLALARADSSGAGATSSHLSMRGSGAPTPRSGRLSLDGLTKESFSMPPRPRGHMVPDEPSIELLDELKEDDDYAPGATSTLLGALTGASSPGSVCSGAGAAYAISPVIASILYGGDAAPKAPGHGIKSVPVGALSAGQMLKMQGGDEDEEVFVPSWLQHSSPPPTELPPTSASTRGSKSGSGASTHAVKKRQDSRRHWT